MRCILFIALFFYQCNSGNSFGDLSPLDEKALLEFKNLKEESRGAISTPEEAGERLLLGLTFVNKETGAPLIEQSVFLYHATHEGEYEPTDPNDESTARLRGSAVTDAQGRIFVATILPGDYGSSRNNRHIHTTVPGAHPETYDIHFHPYTSALGKRFISGSDQHFLAKLKYRKDSTLVAFQTIEVKSPTPP